MILWSTTSWCTYSLCEWIHGCCQVIILCPLKRKVCATRYPYTYYSSWCPMVEKEKGTGLACRETDKWKRDWERELRERNKSGKQKKTEREEGGRKDEFMPEPRPSSIEHLGSYLTNHSSLYLCHLSRPMKLHSWCYYCTPFFRSF